MTEDVFIGRQPICKERAVVFGYELLSREHDLSRAALENDDKAAAVTNIKSSINLGLEKLAGQDLAFVGVSKDFLVNGFGPSLPKGRVVLEIPGDTVMDEP